MSFFDRFRSREQIFEENFLPYLNDIYRTSLRLTRSKDDADDLTQETFFKAYAAFSKGATITSPKAWLFKIMHNIYVNEQTSLSGRAVKIPIEEVAEIQGTETPEDIFLFKTAEEKLSKALRKMQPEYRLVLLLRDSEGLSYSEIAEIMRCPVGTVRSRLNRARETIRSAIHEEQDTVNRAEGKR